MFDNMSETTCSTTCPTEHVDSNAVCVCCVRCVRHTAHMESTFCLGPAVEHVVKRTLLNLLSNYVINEN